MSWVKEKEYKWYERMALNIIRAGPIPRHIAFIMDGNRRFAQNANIQKICGHRKGFEKLSECLQWCLDVGVQEVTAFAFSIENFKRSDDEVLAIMDLAKSKFEDLIKENDRLKEKGVRIRIIGNISLLPHELQQRLAEAMLITEDNDKLFLNIAFAYTSREEITNAFQTIIENSNELEPEDITDDLIEECLYTRNSPPPDLLIRTSGEKRISDFLMWQISTTVLYFSKALWPAITFWNFLYAIFCYQKSVVKIMVYKQKYDYRNSKKSLEYPERIENFLRKVDAKRRDHLVNLANAKFKCS